MGLFSFFGRRKQIPPPTCAAVIVAAGASTRFGDDKLMTLLGGQPVLAHTLRAFEQTGRISRVVVVARQDAILLVQDMCREFGFNKVTDIVPGGETRTASVRCGVAVAGEAAYIAVHDGARPLVTPSEIERVVDAAVAHGAAAPGVPLADTVKVVDERGLVLSTPDRASLRAVRTPQVFDAALLSGALTRAVGLELDFTDDCAAVEAMGMSVHIVDGSPENIKITTPHDLVAAEAILSERWAVV